MANTSHYQQHHKEKISKRYESNKTIMGLLEKFIEDQPNMRFGQILMALGIIEMEQDGPNKFSIKDPFYEESVDTLTKVYKKASVH